MNSCTREKAREEERERNGAIKILIEVALHKMMNSRKKYELNNVLERATERDGNGV